MIIPDGKVLNQNWNKALAAGHCYLFGLEGHIIEEENRCHKQALKKNYTLYIKFVYITYCFI